MLVDSTTGITRSHRTYDIPLVILESETKDEFSNIQYFSGYIDKTGRRSYEFYNRVHYRGSENVKEF